MKLRNNWEAINTTLVHVLSSGGDEERSAFRQVIPPDNYLWSQVLDAVLKVFLFFGGGGGISFIFLYSFNYNAGKYGRPLITIGFVQVRPAKLKMSPKLTEREKHVWRPY